MFCELLLEESLWVINLGLIRPLFLRFSPKSASYELLLDSRCFVNTGMQVCGSQPIAKQEKKYKKKNISNFLALFVTLIE